MGKLTDKQEMFCREYVIDWNATRAAIAAGYSEKTAYSIGNENLTKPEIAAYIEEIQKDLAKLAGISALSNLNHLKEMLEEDEDGKKKETTKDRANAIKIINEMLGLNSPVKTETKHEGGVTMFEIPNNGRGQND